MQKKAGVEPGVRLLTLTTWVIIFTSTLWSHNFMFTSTLWRK